MARDENKPYAVSLTIGHGGKGIPYGGHHGELREDGTTNHGFKNLKGRPHLLDSVPELRDSPALYELVRAINEPDTGLVSVGCAAWDYSDEREGYRRAGYIEFAINLVEMIGDARNYFPMFFHFDKMLHDRRFNEMVNYIWELEWASFWPTKADGFTCAVWIYTPFRPSPEEAKDLWEVALEPLISYLGQQGRKPGTPLFTAETDTELT